MKKLIKLLLVLPLLFVVPVNAKTIDLSGNYFNNNQIYKSGDVYTNLRLHTQSAYFHVWTGRTDVHMEYMDTYNNSDYFDPNDGFIISNDPNKFFIDSQFLNVFDVKVGALSEFRIPKVLDDDVLWGFQDTVESYERNPNTGEFELVGADDADMFNYIKNVPKYTIKCNKNTLNVGDKASCDLYLNLSSYESYMMVYEMFSNYSYSLTSNDYNIENVRINENTDFTYNNGTITGHILKFTGFKDADLAKINEDEFLPSINQYASQYGEFSDECAKPKSEIDYDGKSSKVGEPEGIYDTVNPTCPFIKYSYNLKTATFDITPKSGSPSDGFIGLSNIEMSFSDPYGNNMNSIDIDSTTFESIPITGLVKGVEENPKTGLFNYVLLVIPAGIFVYGIYLLKKKALFKRV